MGPNLRALRLRLLVALVLAAAGFAVPARAQAPAGDPPPRLTTGARPAAGAGGATPGRLRSPATPVGLRGQGHDDAAVEIRWQGIGEWCRWEPVPLWEDAGDHDA